MEDRAENPGDDATAAGVMHAEYVGAEHDDGFEDLRGIKNEVANGV